jgi:hypothetical protein
MPHVLKVQDFSNCLEVLKYGIHWLAKSLLQLVFQMPFNTPYFIMA